MNYNNLRILFYVNVDYIINENSYDTQYIMKIHIENDEFVINSVIKNLNLYGYTYYKGLILDIESNVQHRTYLMYMKKFNLLHREYMLKGILNEL